MPDNLEQQKMNELISLNRETLNKFFPDSMQTDNPHVQKVFREAELQKGNYYIPKETDIKVGYQCEVNQSSDIYKPKWDKINVIPSTIYAVIKMLELSKVRTSYLSVQDLENEGWEITQKEYKPEPYKVDWINAKKADYTLWINLAMRNIMHLGIDKTKSGILYRGSCPSINEFRTICKLLRINE